MNQKFDHLLNLVLIGEQSTGKTNIFKRLSSTGTKYDWDNTSKPTVGIDFTIDTSQIDNQNVKLIIWDMGAILRFRTILKRFYEQASGFLVVYDITDRESLEKIQKWIDEIQCNSQERPHVILIGNKCDLEEERKVSYEEGRSLAEEYGLRFFEVSAKTSENIDFVLKMFKREEVAKAKEKAKMKEKKDVRNRLLRTNYQENDDGDWSKKDLTLT